MRYVSIVLPFFIKLWSYTLVLSVINTLLCYILFKSHFVDISSFDVDP